MLSFVRQAENTPSNNTRFRLVKYIHYTQVLYYYFEKDLKVPYYK